MTDLTATARAATDTALGKVNEMSPNRMSALDWGACQSPDGPDSEGASFLASVRDNYVSAVKEGRMHTYVEGGLGLTETVDNEDTITEIADSAPDVDTNTMWREFVDLGGYSEDPATEYEGPAESMARTSLEIIARRVVNALHTFVTAEVEKAVDAAEETSQES